MDVRFERDERIERERIEKAKLDPLRRVWIPNEGRTAAGTLVFRTMDNEVYARLDDGSIRRTRHKTRGKAARREEKKLRRHANH